MVLRILMVSGLGAVCFFLLSQLPDARVVGIRSEPATILFYGGSGLLAGLFAIGAIVSGIMLGFHLLQRRSMGPPSRLATLAYRLAWGVLASGLVVLVTAMLRRLGS